jgi:hypothetical protein
MPSLTCSLFWARAGLEMETWSSLPQTPASFLHWCVPDWICCGVEFPLFFSLHIHIYYAAYYFGD